LKKAALATDEHGFPFTSEKNPTVWAGLLLCRQKLVQLAYKLIRIRAMYNASIANALATCRGAAKAVHTHFKEILCGSGIKIEYVADNAFFRNSHDLNLLFLLCLL
jgi:hypothetical protein